MSGGGAGLLEGSCSLAAFRRQFCRSGVAFLPRSAVPRFGAPATPSPLSAYAGAPLAALPAAFDIRRLVPLSDPTADTRSAPVLRATIARNAPSSRSSPSRSASTLTPDGTTNIVVADAEANVNGATWVRVGLSILPNDTEGWVPRSSLGAGRSSIRDSSLTEPDSPRRCTAPGGSSFARRSAWGHRARPRPPASSTYATV